MNDIQNNEQRHMIRVMFAIFLCVIIMGFVSIMWFVMGGGRVVHQYDSTLYDYDEEMEWDMLRDTDLSVDDSSIRGASADDIIYTIENTSSTMQHCRMLKTMRNSSEWNYDDVQLHNRVQNAIDVYTDIDGMSYPKEQICLLVIFDLFADQVTPQSDAKKYLDHQYRTQVIQNFTDVYGEGMEDKTYSGAYSDQEIIEWFGDMLLQQKAYIKS